MLKYKFIAVFFALIVFSGAVRGQYLATLNLPDTTAAHSDTIDVAIKVSTTYEIGLAQFILEFDTTVVRFIDAHSGADAASFVMSKNMNLPFAPTSSSANGNFLLQLSGGGTSTFSGQDKEVAVTTFVVKSASGTTPLIFDPAANHTFLSTTTLTDISGGDINFINGSITSMSSDVKNPENFTAPKNFLLRQNYPNPFNPTTTIQFELPALSFVNLKIFDAMGREIRTLLREKLPAGQHRIVIDAEDLPSGVYFYRLQAAGKSATKKLILLR
ncbi:MAG: T9SS type A sorting domain-containing protein [Calditrichaeota bacterium]|nr:T9SS type A sorting domain-containing protein [Calditrichota bacterium]